MLKPQNAEWFAFNEKTELVAWGTNAKDVRFLRIQFEETHNVVDIGDLTVEQKAVLAALTS